MSYQKQVRTVDFPSQGFILLFSMMALLSWTPAKADISDAIFFNLELPKTVDSVATREYCVVHYYRSHCACCQEAATKWARCFKNRQHLCRYLPKQDADIREPLPHFEVYDPNGKLLCSGDQAKAWLERRAKAKFSTDS